MGRERICIIRFKSTKLRDKAAQVTKSREENRQRNEETNLNSEIEASDNMNGIQEQDIHENITVCKVNNINEEVINANLGPVVRSPFSVNGG